jgi:hypothetical protein
MKRRSLAILVVAGTAALASAFATPGDHLTIGPPSLQVTSGGSSSSVNAVNDGSNALSITSIAKDNCNLTDDNGISANFINHGTNMFTMNVSDQEPIVMMCPSSTFKGISRCKFDVMAGSTVLDSATQICLYSSGMPVITASPQTVNFGNVPLNGNGPGSFMLSTTMSTTGVYLSIADDEGNFQFTAPCTSGPHCHDTTVFTMGTNKTIGVACTPKRTGPLQSDIFIIGDNGISLSGTVHLLCNTGTTSDPDIDVPASVTMSRHVNAGAVTTPMTLINMGPGDLDISSITIPGGTGWAVDSVSTPCDTLPCTVPGNQMIAVTLRFDPSVIGPNNTTLTIQSNDPDEMTATVALNGTGDGSTLHLITAHGSPDFIGTAMIGSSVTKTYVLEDAPGTEGMMLTASLSNTTDFSLDTTFANLNPGDMPSFTVTCTPPSSATTSSMLTFSADSTFGSPIQFMVQCAGDTTPVDTLSATPNSIMLDEVRIGYGARTVPVHVSTTSPTSMMVTAQPADAPDLANLTTTNLSADPIVMGPGADFNVVFNPVTEGVSTSSINLTAGGETLTIPFTANVVKVDLQEPADLDFGTICVGKPAPQAQMLTLHEAGSAKIHLASKPDVAATSAFTVERVTPTDTGYPFDLLASQSASVRVQPKMQTVAMRYEDDLAWNTDTMPATSTHLSVEFLDDKGGVTPGSVDFGSAQLRQTSETKMVTIQNCSAGTLTVSAPAFDSKQFVLVTPPPASLAAGETATVAMAFIPEKVGVQIGKMTIDTSSGPLVVDLAGTGLGDGVTQSARASLYACDCSTGNPASAFLIVLALTIPLIPRRRRR